MRVYERSEAYEIAAAKVLEIPDQTFGLKAIRARILKSGASNWRSWASAMGARTLSAAERNYVLGYFANGSPMNHLIANCVEKITLMASVAVLVSPDRRARRRPQRAPVSGRALHFTHVAKSSPRPICRSNRTPAMGTPIELTLPAIKRSSFDDGAGHWKRR